MTQVLFRRGALGDVVLLGSVTAGAPEPVHVVTDARYAGLVRKLRGVAQVHIWGDKRMHLPDDARRVDLQGSIRTAHRRINKRSVRRRVRLLSDRVAPRPSVPTLYAEACGWDAVSPVWFRLPEHRRDVLALVPGASTGPKRWTANGYVQLGQRWEGPVVVLGGPDERGLVEQVAKGIPGAVALAEDGFSETLLWLARARVAVAGDSGLMHLAGACGVPVVALFGPTHTADGFFVYRGEAVERKVFCRPCTLHRATRCWTGTHRCMEHTVDTVWAAVCSCAG
jgi:ADP-heptose:LPS heptosyltransferase